MPKIPDSTKASLHHRLIDRSRQRLAGNPPRYACAIAASSPTSTASWPTARCCGWSFFFVARTHLARLGHEWVL